MVRKRPLTLCHRNCYKENTWYFPDLASKPGNSVGTAFPCLYVPQQIARVHFARCFHFKPWILMVGSLPNSPFSSLLLSIQTDCIYQIGCLADICAPDSKMHEMNQKGRTGF